MWKRRVPIAERAQVTAFWERYIATRSRDIDALAESQTALLTYRAITDAAGVSRDDPVLEVGCGWGRVLTQFRRDGFGRLFGVDLTLPLLIRCRETVQPHVCQGDIRQLSFTTDFFELVYAVRVLQYVPDVGTAILEMTRVTKPGGCVVVIQPNGKNPIRRLWYHTVLVPFEQVVRSFQQADLELVTTRYFGFTHPKLPFRGFERLGRIPVVQKLAAFYLVAGRKPHPGT